MDKLLEKETRIINEVSNTLRSLVELILSIGFEEKIQYIPLEGYTEHWYAKNGKTIFHSDLEKIVLGEGIGYTQKNVDDIRNKVFGIINEQIGVEKC